MLPYSTSIQTRTLLTLALLCPPLLLSGCTASTERIAAELADRSLRKQHLLQIIEGDLALYQSCLDQRGGTCTGGSATPLPAAVEGVRTPVEPGLGDQMQQSLDQLPPTHPARLAQKTLNHPVLSQATSLHNALGGFEPKTGLTMTGKDTEDGRQSTLRMDVSVSQASDFGDQLHRTVASGGWTALRQHAEGRLAAAAAGSDDQRSIAKDHRRVAFIEKYIEAYFHNGRFVAVDFTLPADEARQALARDLARHVPEACSLFNLSQGLLKNSESGGSTSSAGAGDGSCDGLAQKLYEQLRGSSTSIDKQLVKVSQSGFVSRDGSYTAQFPEFAIDIAPLNPSLVSVSADGAPVKRIDFTRIGSDLVRITLQAIFDAHEGLPAVPQATGRQLGDLSLPLFSPPMGHVSTDDLNAIVNIQETSASSTGVILDRLIRGIGPFSLNNEALEELIVTLVTTSVREAVAKASWCWYACDLDQDLARVEADARQEVQTLKGKAEDFAERSLHRVQLDLRLKP